MKLQTLLKRLSCQALDAITRTQPNGCTAPEADAAQEELNRREFEHGPDGCTCSSCEED